jgi:WD40 repeat protein/tRNA A-37 threonylcarbamoyl transferase component Bud32
MSDTAKVSKLLLRWEELRQQGRMPAVQELCRDCPELIPEVARRLAALQAVYAAGESGDTPPHDPEAATSPTAAPVARPVGYNGDAATPPLAASAPDTRPGERAQADAWATEQGAASAGAAMPAVPGYEVLGVLGRGGMGVVYKARQVKLDRLVALKMVLAGGHASADELARFKTEAEAVARLQHPNVVQVYEVGESEGRPFFSLEFCAGGSLADKLDGTPWRPEKAAPLVETLARAMEAAHQRGIVHRDLKPANVLLTADGQPKVTDFGLAKRLDRGQGDTRTGSVIGTPSYMAPEQAGGHTRDVGPACDVYSLGAVLYELLTGRPPFKEPTPLETVRQVMSAEPVPLRHLQARVPRDLETISHKCLQKEPRNRYASALDLADDLGRFLRREPIRARPVGPLARGWRWCRRNPLLAGVSGLAAGGLVAATVVSLLLALQQADSAARRAEAADALTAKQAQTEAALWTARRQSSLLFLERGLTSCEQGEDSVGLLWFARSLIEAPEGTDDLRRAIRGCIANTARRLCPLVGVVSQQGAINAVAVSPDGRLFATASSDHTAQLWEVRTGRPRGPALRHAGRVWAVAFSPDGKRLLTGAADRTARLWDVCTGRPLDVMLKHPDEVRAVAFSPDGCRILTGCVDKTARLWDADTGKPAAAWPAHKDTVKAVAFSSDGTRLLTGSWDGTARQWDARTCRPVGPVLVHRNWVNAVAFSADGKLLLTGSDDHTARLWQADTGKPVGDPLSHTGGVFAAAFSPDGRFVVTGSGDHHARIWETRSGRPAGVPLLHPSFVLAAAFTPDGRFLVTGCDDQSARVWAAAPADRAPPPLPHGAGVAFVHFGRAGRTVWTGSADQTVRCWSVAGGRPAGAPLHLAKGTEVLAFSPDGKAFVEGCQDRTARLWDLAAGKPTRTVRLPDVMHAGAFSPDGGTVVIACEGGSVSRWRPRPGESPQPLLKLPELVHALAVSPDGRVLATGGEDHTARLWDLATAERLGPPLPHQGEVYAVAFSPDGRRLLTGSGDRTARVWEVATGKRLGLPLKHGDAVWSVAFSPDGQAALTGSGDKTARLWDIASGQPLAPPFRHLDDVRAVAFSSDGRTVLTGSLDQTARLWEVQPPLEGDPECLALAAAVLTGMELGQDNTPGRLDPETWGRRARRLRDLSDGPLLLPPPARGS